MHFGFQSVFPQNKNNKTKKNSHHQTKNIEKKNKTSN